ncbi:MAG: hypothetical protein WBA10_11820 [Elainellaceae cyanobacterium]
MLNRVPEVTAVFWIIKVLATTVGETAADYLAFTLNFGLAVTSYIMGALLLVVLANQFRLKRYIPASYWSVVVLISIVGTLITDRLVDEFGVSLVTTTVAFSIGLAVVFAIWYANEKTLAMHSINTARREAYYWVAILMTFALGTAAGDLLAEGSGLGYAQALVIFAALIGLVAVAYYYLHLNGVLAFWLAYILTRPLGASTGDLLSQSAKNGGLGLGTTDTSILFLCVIASLVIYQSLRLRRLNRRAVVK